MSQRRLQQDLTLFDVTNLVVGAIIGADIYVASSFGAGFLGPLSLLVWVFAGFIAIVIALCFAQCAAYLPKVGGPYAYAKEAWGPFPGFLVGWSLWLAEWISLAVFPVAFTRYLMFFLPNLDWITQTAVKGIFIASIAFINIIGVKAAGRVNDFLTIAKLAPLILFSAVGFYYILNNPGTPSSNLSPFAPFGLSNFGTALVLIFWAYAGFELSTIPAEEINEPSRTIPRAIVLGILIVTIFYLTTNAILFGVRPWSQLAQDTAPLASATSSILGGNSNLALVGVLIVGGGALVSVAGSDESAMLGTSRLGYALAFDGLFPRAFARVHPKYKTPHISVIIQAVTSFVAAILGNLSALIASSVLFIAIAYFATSISIFFLSRRAVKPKFILRGGRTIPILGAIFSLYLISQCSIQQFEVGGVLIIVGILMYVKLTPKNELSELKREYLSAEEILERTYRQEENFLAHALRHVKRLYRRLRGRKQAWTKS